MTSLPSPMRLALILALLPSLLLAQEARKISLRTLCFKRVGAVKELLLLTGTEDDPKPIPVPLYISIYSDEIPVEISRDTLTFALEKEGPDGEPTYQIVAEGKLQEGARQVAVFIPSGDPKMPYSVLSIDDTEAAFPLGSTFIVNLCPEPTRFTIGEHDEIVASGKTARVAIATNVNDLKQATVRVYVPGPDKKWRPVSSTVWKALPDYRNIAISYLNPRNGRTSVNCYQEVPPWRLPKFDAPEGE